MDEAAPNRDRRLADSELVGVSVAFEGTRADIAEGRRVARCFLDRVQTVHGLPVSDRAMGMVQLVVSELVTNAVKHAPGPCLLEVQLVEGRIEITVWDSAPTLPVARA